MNKEYMQELAMVAPADTPTELFKLELNYCDNNLPWLTYHRLCQMTYRGKLAMWGVPAHLYPRKLRNSKRYNGANQ